MENLINDLIDNNKEVQLAIEKKSSWESISKELKSQLIVKKNWHIIILKYSLKHQLRWKGNLISSIVAEEKAYYIELIKKSTANFLLYPYHLSDVLIKGLRFTPFKYYFEMLKIIMQMDKSYDILPNFTAADAYRLLGIGRNQYINIMNESKIKPKFPWQKKPSIEELLPSQPIDIKIQHWWVVQIGYVSSEDIKFCNKLEHATIDTLIEVGPILAGKIDKDTVQSLYKKGLIYLDIPIESNDKVLVLPLEGFVMNRVVGDNFEKLLYKIFVSSDERTTISQLSNVLDIEEQLIKRAMSTFIRLGFAEKKHLPPLKITESSESTEVENWHQSWISESEKLDTSMNISKSDISLSEEQVSSPLVSRSPNNTGKRIGILYDSSLTAFLMMGNLTQGLKKYAVVLFEVGKLTEEQMDDFLGELDKVENFGEGEAVRYFEHAITLRDTLRFFRENRNFSQLDDWDGGVNLLRVESMLHLDTKTMQRVLSENYVLLISMAQMQNHLNCTIPPKFGPPLKEVNSVWFKMYLYAKLGSGPTSIVFPMGTRIDVLPPELKQYKEFKIVQWSGDETITSSNSVLLMINHYLIYSPILVQGYVKHTDPKYLALPLNPNKIKTLIDFGQSEPSSPQKQTEDPEDDKIILDYGEKNTISQKSVEEDEEETLAEHDLVKKLNQFLSLSNFCGYIEMIDVGSKHHSEWLISNVHFGIPFFDGKLNASLLLKMKTVGILDSKKISHHCRESRKLSLSLLNFISNFSGETVGMRENVPYPESVIVFHNGKISSK